MAGKQQSRGICQFCGYETTKAAMVKHLEKCPKRQERITAATSKAKGPPETLFYLRAYDAYSKDFWIDLEVCGSAKLKDIDSYLRAIWLECCGHMSQFSVGGWRGSEIAKSRRVEDIFRPGMELTHIYDFGTSSETMIKEIEQHEGVPLTRKPIVLMARNNMPETACIVCGQPAAYLCMECLIEDQSPGTLCSLHAQDHPHHDYGEPMELVNSPRMGMCGYTGPAEPPY